MSRDLKEIKKNIILSINLLTQTDDIKDEAHCNVL